MKIVVSDEHTDEIIAVIDTDLQNESIIKMGINL